MFYDNNALLRNKLYNIMIPAHYLRAKDLIHFESSQHEDSTRSSHVNETFI